MNPDAIFDSYPRQWRDFTVAGGGEVVDLDGLQLNFTPSTFPPFNPTLVLFPPSDPAAALDEAIAHYRKRGRESFGFELRVGFAPQLEAEAERRGMETIRTFPMMVRATSGVEPLDHDVREVRDERAYDDFIAAQAAGFETPAEDLRAFIPYRVVGSSTTLLTAYDGDAPVATSAAVVADGIGGIYAVATHPDYRRRGFGAAATIAAIRHANAGGATDVLLIATPMGEPVYRALGFETIADYRVYSMPLP